VAVTREELPDAERRRRAGGADEQHVSNSPGHERAASVDERRHEHFAHVSIGLNQRVHLIARQLDDLARLAGADAHHRRTTEDHADFASELPRPERGDDEVARAGRADDLDLTSLHHEERHVGLAAFDQHFAAGDAPSHSV
jgi:hypothetical protein